MSLSSSSLENISNWALRYSTSENTDLGNGYYTELPEINPPINLQSSVIILQTVTLQPNRKMVGWLNQIVPVGIGGGQNTRIASRKVFFGTTLLVFNPQITNYYIQLKPTKWVYQITLTLYEYVGAQPVSNETQLTQIQASLNILLSQQQAGSLPSVGSGSIASGGEHGVIL